MKQVVMVLAAASVLVSGSALASADIAKAKNCMACHAVQTKLVGPSFKDVAAKYNGQKGIEDKLVAKIIKGGSGSWGAIPMPANPQVSDAEAKALVKWIMAQK
ncbi:MAG TPA: c-type cytochrome [Telluria sp.]